MIENYEQHLKTGGEYKYIQDVLYTKKDGSPLFVNCSGNIIKNSKGEAVFMVGSHEIIDETWKRRVHYMVC